MAQTEGMLKPEVVKALQLTDRQVQELRILTERYLPQIAAAEDAAAMTPSQLERRDLALRKAFSAGKRGRAASESLGTAGTWTRLQATASRDAIQLRSALDASMFAVLSAEQRRKIAEKDVSLQDQFTGMIVVKLSSGLQRFCVGDGSLTLVANQAGLADLSTVLKTYGLDRTHRVLGDITPSQLPLQSQSSNSLFRRLETYWRIDARHLGDAAEEVVVRLNQLPCVDLAYRDLATSNPAVSVAGVGNPLNNRQEYLDAAPKGIDARFAWTQSGGRGGGVGLVDVEHTWNIHHEDLAGQSPRLIFGDIRPGDHGTCVLGVAAASDNPVGVVGVVPAIDYLCASSNFKKDQGGVRVAEAILRATDVMDVGDILLLELETSAKPASPIEVQDLEFDAIRYAVSMGIIVIEPSGNGFRDLDQYQNSLGKKILKRSDPDFRDSGAIFVGASAPEDQHNRTPWSNHGSRLDCFAWGRGVVTSGTMKGIGDLSDGGGDPNKTYTARFDGGSAASAIVAGAAVLLQGMAKANSGHVLTPAQMRSILSSRTTGTPQGPTVPGNIGVMPNLKAIIQSNSVFKRTH